MKNHKKRSKNRRKASTTNKNRQRPSKRSKKVNSNQKPSKVPQNRSIGASVLQWLDYSPFTSKVAGSILRQDF